MGRSLCHIEDGKGASIVLRTDEIGQEGLDLQSRVRLGDFCRPAARFSAPARVRSRCAYRIQMLAKASPHFLQPGEVVDVKWCAMHCSATRTRYRQRYADRQST